MYIAINALEAKKERLLNVGRYRKNRRQENSQYYSQEIAQLNKAIEVLKMANDSEKGGSNLEIKNVTSSFTRFDMEKAFLAGDANYDFEDWFKENYL